MRIGIARLHLAGERCGRLWASTQTALVRRPRCRLHGEGVSLVRSCRQRERGQRGRQGESDGEGSRPVEEVRSLVQCV